MKTKWLPIFLGIITGLIVVFLGDMLNQRIYPPPAGLDFNNKEAIENFVKTMPINSLLLMISFWLCSSFFGGLVAGFLNKEAWKKNSIVVGTILMLGALSNMIMIPHPIWMIVVSILFYVPLSLAAGFIAGKKFEQEKLIQ